MSQQNAAWLARDLGANRQNVQRIVNDLGVEGLVVFAPNQHHKRAQLVGQTAKGRAVLDAAIALYRPQVEELTAAGKVMRVPRARLASDAG